MIIQRRPLVNDATSTTFNLFVNVEGSVEVEHGARFSKLTAGDALLLDGSRTFSLDIRSDYRQLLIQFPRDAVGRRHPELMRSAGFRFSSEHPVVPLLTQIAHLLTTRPPSSFDPISDSYAYDAMLTLLGALQFRAIDHHSVGGHRFVRALADIDGRVSEPGLSAVALANLQGITRRRLDAIFAVQGLTVEQAIWTRRLERAANEIIASSKSARKLLDIALACGFSSEAHFSRRFRAHFGLSPSEYRRAGSAAPPARDGRRS